MGAILEKMAIFSNGNALCPVENPFKKVFPILKFFYERISFYKRMGAILKKMAIFSKGNALRPVESLTVGVFFFNECFENRYILYF